MKRRRSIVRLVVLALLVAFLVDAAELSPSVFQPLTKNGQPAIYTQGSLLDLTLNHLAHRR